MHRAALGSIVCVPKMSRAPARASKNSLLSQQSGKSGATAWEMARIGASQEQGPALEPLGPSPVGAANRQQLVASWAIPHGFASSVPVFGAPCIRQSSSVHDGEPGRQTGAVIPPGPLAGRLGGGATLAPGTAVARQDFLAPESIPVPPAPAGWASSPASEKISRTSTLHRLLSTPRRCP